MAFSHEATLQRFGLGEAFPAKLHLTAPAAFRSKPPRDVVVHEADLAFSNRHAEGVLHYATPVRTLRGVVTDGAVSDPDRDDILVLVPVLDEERAAWPPVGRMTCRRHDR